MNPTIGRIVHYILTTHDQEHGCGSTGATVAAVVVAVHNSTCVNLRLFTDGPGAPPHRRNVCQGPAMPGSWSWPPQAPSSSDAPAKPKADKPPKTGDPAPAADGIATSPIK